MKFQQHLSSGKLAILALASLFVACNQATEEKSNDQSNVILIDTHNDVLSGTVLKGFDISNRLDTGNTDLVRLQEGGVDVQIFAVFGNGTHVGEPGFQYANRQIDSFYAVIERNPTKIGAAHTVEEARALISDNRMAGMIALEGGHMLNDQLSNLDSLARRGIVYMTLTWNNSNNIASSSADEEHPDFPEEKKGLSEFGHEVIHRMNELGLTIDLSHVGEKAFYEVLNATTLPVLATHSNARVLCDVHRNLKDEQIEAIAETNGVICVTFYAPFIRPETEDDFMVTMDDLIDHIDHIVKLTSIDHVGIGSDFFGLTNDAYPQGLQDASMFPNLIDALYERGYSEEDVRKIASENVFRVLEENQQAKSI